MRALDSLKLAFSLARTNRDAHLADIAILKADALRVGHSQRLRERLASVAGYLPDIDLEALAELAGTTFGHAYATFMRQNALSLFLPTELIDARMRERNAFGIRYATTHDMVHVLTGFDTSWAGEIGVLAFAVAQRYTRWQQLALVIAACLYPFFYRFRVRALWRAATRGYALGRRARCVLSVRLEERFEQPLEEVRRELGIAPP
jgi:ubiquinone biosynthesis protein COQ4